MYVGWHVRAGSRRCARCFWHHTDPHPLLVRTGSFGPWILRYRRRHWNQASARQLRYQVEHNFGGTSRRETFPLNGARRRWVRVVTKFVPVRLECSLNSRFVPVRTRNLLRDGTQRRGQRHVFAMFVNRFTHLRQPRNISPDHQSSERDFSFIRFGFIDSCAISRHVSSADNCATSGTGHACISKALGVCTMHREA